MYILSITTLQDCTCLIYQSVFIDLLLNGDNYYTPIIKTVLAAHESCCSRSLPV